MDSVFITNNTSFVRSTSLTFVVTWFTFTRGWFVIVTIFTETVWKVCVSSTSHTVTASFNTGHTFTVTVKDSSRSNWEIDDFNGIDTLWNDWTIWDRASFWTTFSTFGTTMIMIITCNTFFTFFRALTTTWIEDTRIIKSIIMVTWANTTVFWSFSVTSTGTTTSWAGGTSFTLWGTWVTDIVEFIISINTWAFWWGSSESVNFTGFTREVDGTGFTSWGTWWTVGLSFNVIIT